MDANIPDQRYGINDEFLRKAISLRGESGKLWVGSIPRIIEEYEKRWSIKVDQPFALSYNYVAPATKSDGTPVVLKIGLDFNSEFISEIEALRCFDGQGAVRLLEADIDDAVVLLERVEPGLPLDQLNDDEKETRIASELARRLWRPIPRDCQSLIALETWYEGFERHRKRFGGGSGPLPSDVFQKGEDLFGQLLKTTDAPMLIHGDFHHGNILSSKRDNWLVIDPKGVFGDPIYDLAVFLYNPTPDLSGRLNIKALLERRIEIFSEELALDKKRIAQWGVAQAVLSSLWTVEERETGWEQTMGVADILAGSL